MAPIAGAQRETQVISNLSPRADLPRLVLHWRGQAIELGFGADLYDPMQVDELMACLHGVLNLVAGAIAEWAALEAAARQREPDPLVRQGVSRLQSLGRELEQLMVALSRLASGARPS